MRIRNRVLLSFGAVILVMGAIGLIALLKLTSISVAITHLHDEIAIRSCLAQVRRDTQSRATLILQRVINQDDTASDTLDARIRQLDTAIEHGYETYASLINQDDDPASYNLETRLLFSDVRESAREYRAIAGDALTLARTGHDSEARLSATKNIAPALERHMAHIDAIWDRQSLHVQDLADENVTLARDASLLLLVSLATLLPISILSAFLLTRFLTLALSRSLLIAGQVAQGRLDVQIPDSHLTADETGDLLRTLRLMVANLRQTDLAARRQDWLKSALARLARLLQEKSTAAEVAAAALREIAQSLQIPHGVLYLAESPDLDAATPLRLAASYALSGEAATSRPTILPGHGLVGQCALDRRPVLLASIPPDYIRIGSALGDAPPVQVRALPILFHHDLVGVIELAFLAPPDPVETDYLLQATEITAISLAAARAAERTRHLLGESQSLSEELQAQQEELRQSNDELKVRGLQLEQSRREIQEEAAKVAEASRYKSEFLANMSHELRTPLNSLLILSELLAQNEKGNLDDKQVQFARTIHSAGTDLLNLINDILDMSKVEAGMMRVALAPISIRGLLSFIRPAFQPLADKQGLQFHTETDPTLPETLHTDPQRLQQIIKNLLSNAFKFTSGGSVTLSIAPGLPLAPAGPPSVRFTVRDTGIGIQPDKLDTIFEAFRQADGSISRQYGGTGLGLSISRKLAHLLGGILTAASVPGQGSAFTLALPLLQSGDLPLLDAETALHLPEPSPLLPEPRLRPSASGPLQTEDDRENLQPGDRTLLVIEDDEKFAAILLDLARQRGFKTLLATRGDTGLALARQHLPSAITLDRQLPGLDGLVILERLKQDPLTRAIPVHMISAHDDPDHHALRAGAIGHLPKPATPESLRALLDHLGSFTPGAPRRILLVEDDPRQTRALRELLDAPGLDIISAPSGSEALALLETQRFDCMILDLALPDMTGHDLLRRLQPLPAAASLPVVIYTGRDLDETETDRLAQFSRTIILKDANSPQRLLAEVTLFLHSVESRLPAAQRDLLRQTHEHDTRLEGRTILVVDDDIRNIYALLSLLEAQSVLTLKAKNGREAIEALQANPQTDLVLMDVMMPEMDGYEAIGKIRLTERGRRLPIIAVTAKAMKGEREKCIEAGASDYIAKPIDPAQLLSLLRVWLYERK